MTHLANYGPYILKSALQPIFKLFPDNHIELYGYEGLIRPFQNGKPASPAEFFPRIAQEDEFSIDNLCRVLHINNYHKENRPQASLFLNFNHSLLVNDLKILECCDVLMDTIDKNDIDPSQIICEITEEETISGEILTQFTHHLRSRGFRIAIDDFGVHGSDIERVETIHPDIVKFDINWVRYCMKNQAGVSLLKIIIERMKDKGIKVLFEGLEEDYQVDICAKLQIDYVQGFALARPKIVPTDFNILFPINPKYQKRETTQTANTSTLSPFDDKNYLDDHADKMRPTDNTLDNAVRSNIQKKRAGFGKRG